MNVLLIACSYPPDPLVGSFRAAKVAEAFRSAGHQVDVITARLQGERETMRVAEPGLRVHTVRMIPNPRHLYVWGKSRVVSTEPGARVMEPRVEDEGTKPPRDSVPHWKRLLISALWVPDDLQGFIAPALIRSVPLLRRGVDLVYTTAPPFSDHLVGLFLKRMLGIRWAAEFRDPWTDNPEKSPRTRSRPADAANRWLERKCLANADHVVAVAEATRELLAAKMPPDRRDCGLLALNGIDRIDPPREGERAPGPFRIVYTGSFSAGRDPRPFLIALSGLRRKRAIGPGDLQVEIIGSTRQYDGRSLEALVRDLEVTELVRFVDWLPQEQARGRMRAADLLLLLFRDQRIQIPNKLYDYLGARRPILAMVDPAGEAARMLRRVGGHHLVFDDDPSSIERALGAALAMPRGTGPADEVEAVLAEWSTERQMEHLITALGAGSRTFAETTPDRTRPVSV